MLEHSNGYTYGYSGIGTEAQHEDAKNHLHNSPARRGHQRSDLVSPRKKTLGTKNATNPEQSESSK
jgi:hypothetical protein